MAGENSAEQPERYRPVRGADIRIPAEAEDWLICLARTEAKIGARLKRLEDFGKEVEADIAREFQGRERTPELIEEVVRRYWNKITGIRRSTYLHLAADLVADMRYRARVLKKLDSFDLGEGLGHLSDARAVDAAIDFDGRRTVRLRVGAAVREIKFPVVIDAGIWRTGSYEKGDAVTWAGSYWIATRDTAVPPGTADSGWRLAVKKGRDGKDTR